MYEGLSCSDIKDKHDKSAKGKKCDEKQQKEPSICVRLKMIVYRVQLAGVHQQEDCQNDKKDDKANWDKSRQQVCCNPGIQ